MERCYECGKRDWRIGSTYQSIRRWFRLKVGIDKPPPKMSPEMLKVLATESAVLKYMAAIPTTPPPYVPGGPVVFRPIMYTHTNPNTNPYE